LKETLQEYKQTLTNDFPFCNSIDSG
jgi:hypothetical protein